MRTTAEKCIDGLEAFNELIAQPISYLALLTIGSLVIAGKIHSVQVLTGCTIGLGGGAALMTTLSRALYSRSMGDLSQRTADPSARETRQQESQLYKVSTLYPAAMLIAFATIGALCMTGTLSLTQTGWGATGILLASVPFGACCLWRGGRIK